MTHEPIQMKLSFVLKKYGIEPKENFKFGFFSMANEVFFLKDKHGKRYVLKNCLKNNSIELLKTEIALIEHLRARGCGAPEVVKATNGDDYVEYNGDIFIMYRFLKGEIPSWHTIPRRYHMRQSARGMAIYHRAVADFDPSYDTDRFKVLEFERNIKHFTDLKAALEADDTGRESVSGMLKIIDFFIDLAKRLPSLFPEEKLRRCQSLMIHGDLHMYNMAFRFQRFSAVYDFDFIRRDLRLFDAVNLIWSFENLLKRKAYGERVREPGFNPDPEKIIRIMTKSILLFARAYRKEYPISDEELSLLPAMRAVLTLYFARFFRMETSEEERLHMLGWLGFLKQRLPMMLEGMEEATRRALKELNS